MILLLGKLKYRRSKKGFVVYYDFTNQYHARDRISLKIIVDNPSKNKVGEYIFPLEAIDIAKAIDRNVQEHRWGISKKKTPITLSQLMELFFTLDGSIIEEQSRSLYRQIVGLFVSHFGDTPINQITEDMLFSFRKIELERDISPYTVAKYLRTLKSLFSFAVHRDLMRKNPVTRALKIKLPDKQPVIYAQSEIELLFAYLEKHDLDLKRQLEFLLLTGFRVSESCLFTFDRIDVQLQTLLYWNKKKKRDELFPISDRLNALLESCPRTWYPRVFKYETRYAVYKRFKHALATVGITKKIAIHNLKATYATSIARAGADIKMLHELSHHKSEQTTMRHYLFVDLEEKRKMLNKVETLRAKMAQNEISAKTPTTSRKRKAL